MRATCKGAFLYHTCLLYTSSAKVQTEEIELPIIMYHSMLKDGSGKYIISPDTFEEDLQYLKDNGYTTIHMQDLLNYVNKGTALPRCV